MGEKPLFKENSDNHQSLIKANTLGVLLVAFLVVKILLAVLIPQGKILQASDLSASNILQAVNAQRSLRNLTILNTNNKLGFAAQSKADDMQARHYFAHVDPDGHYVWDKIVAAGYTPYLELGENLAIEFYDTDSLVSAWMNSPTHRANLLNDGFRDQGMGLTFGNTTQNQYHSAIVNTFGTLAPTPKLKTSAVTAKPATTPKPTAPKPPVAQTPKPKTLGSEQKSTTTPSQTLSPTTTPPALLPEPILPREELALNLNPQSNFALPSQPKAATSSSSSPLQISQQPKEALVGQQNTSALSGYQTNRYLVLLAGVVLLLIMLSDIKKHIQNKFQHLDKKFNNLIVLIISLVVVAFMYWL